MFDNDTKEKVYTGVRASNTRETLKPQDIFAGRTATISEGVADSLGCTIDDNGTLHAKIPLDLPKETIYRPSTKSGDIYALKSYLPEPPKKAQPVEERPLTDRVTRLEELVDALYDRIALHNVKSSHKI
jgi:hypothetical protein